MDKQLTGFQSLPSGMPITKVDVGVFGVGGECRCYVCKAELLNDDDVLSDGGGYCASHSILNPLTGQYEQFNPLPTVYSVTGYFKPGLKDDCFEDYLIYEEDALAKNDELSDEQIFFYGMSAAQLQRSIESGEESVEDFVITSFCVYREDPEWWHEQP